MNLQLVMKRGSWTGVWPSVVRSDIQVYVSMVSCVKFLMFRV